MFAQEEGRRKQQPPGSLKSVFGSNSHNALNPPLEKKIRELSREKARGEPQEIIDPKASATINFRSIKNNQNSQLNPSRLAKQTFPLKVAKKTSAPEPPPIQINLNIQNVLSARRFNLTEAHSDRSLSHRKNEERKELPRPPKNKVAPRPPLTDDFACDQELEIRPQRRREKKQGVAVVAPAPLVEKKPALSTGEIQRELREFQGRCEQLRALGEAEAVCYLQVQQNNYIVDPLYIEKRQKQFSWTMRAILMEWMMHISYQFRLTRETLHTSLALVDIFFQTVPHLAKADFQLAGAAALYIAAKLQEFQPLTAKQLSRSTKQRYNEQQIKGMEMRMCKNLKYQLNPPTLNMWANKIMQQWDLSLQAGLQQQRFFQSRQPKYFKRVDEDSYKHFRQVMQILDCVILDIQTVQYKPKILVCSLLYLILGKQFDEFPRKKITAEFPRTSRFILEETDYNSMFSQFLVESFGLQMFEILPSVQYLATFFTMPLSYDRPCLRPEDEDVENMHLEEYCSFQTYNPHMMTTVRKRFRGIYQ